MDALTKALVAASAEMGAGVVRNAKNPHLGNRYADLSAVVELMKPILAKHGLVFIQWPGKIENDVVVVHGALIHESSTDMRFETHIPLTRPKNKDGSPGPVTAQTVGGAITYGRRYQIKAVFGLADVDDDGNVASSIGSDYSDLTARIALCWSTDALQALRGEVEACDDNEVRTAYLQKRKSLRGAKG